MVGWECFPSTTYVSGNSSYTVRKYIEYKKELKCGICGNKTNTFFLGMHVRKGYVIEEHELTGCSEGCVLNQFKEILSY